jgi:hypothetical protein
MLTLMFYLFAFDLGARDRLTPESVVFWIYLFMPVQVIARTLGLSWTWDDPFSTGALLQVGATCLFNALICLPFGAITGVVVSSLKSANKRSPKV